MIVLIFLVGFFVGMVALVDIAIIVGKKEDKKHIPNKEPIYKAIAELNQEPEINKDAIELLFKIVENSDER